MFLSNYAIDRPVATIVVMIAIVAAGLFGIISLSTDEFPEIEPPVIAVSIAYPGASPVTVERELVDPLEERLASIAGVDEIRSTSVDGFARFVIVFLFEIDVATAAQDIRDEISAIRADLPPEIEEPVIRRFDPDDLPIISLALLSTRHSIADLTRLADPQMTRELRALRGVAQVNIVGGLERELSVLLRPDALQASGLGVAQVVQALEMQNVEAPAGRVSDLLSERAIRLRGRLAELQDFRELVVTQRDGRLIRLNDVADVEDGTEEPRSLALYNGQPTVSMEVVRARGYSTTDVSDRVKARIPDLEAALPDGVTLAVVQDAGERVRASVRNVTEALIVGIVLAVIVVFVFLQSWRSTVIVANTLPISMLAALAAVWAFGFTLNVMTLLGLTLAIGLLIDDAIVMRENIARHIQQGSERARAARAATDEIGLAVSATTLTIVSVFVPVAFISGMAGQWLRPFALTVASAVLVSLFVTFTLDPMVSSKWHDPQLARDYRPGHLLWRALARFNRWFDLQTERYTRVMAWALTHRLAVGGIAVGAFAGALALQTTFGGAAFAPVSDESELNIEVESPPGSSLEYTRLKAGEAAALLHAHPEVNYTYVTVGAMAGGPAGPEAGAVDRANIYVRLVPRRERRASQQALAAQFRREMDRIAGAEFGMAGPGFGGRQRQLEVQIRGQETDTLLTLARQAAERVRRVDGTVDVTLSTRGRRPEIEIDIDRGLAGTVGLTVADIARALRPAFAGIDAGNWVDPDGETWPVRVRLHPDERRQPAALARLPLVVAGAHGPAILPLGQVATIVDGHAPAQIDRIDRDRVISVLANVHERPLNEVLRGIDDALAAMSVPAGYRIVQAGEAEIQEEVFGQVFLTLAAGILLMYLILVVLFDSFVAPIAILASLPLALVGVFVALVITGDTLNIMSLIGVVLLAGIVTKESILLIDFAKRGTRAGLDRPEALQEAGRIRLRPILMTTAALVAGMLPVAIGMGEGADFRAPLGRAVVGGTIAGALLTLLVIPTFYDWLEASKERVATRWTLLRRRAGR